MSDRAGIEFNSVWSQSLFSFHYTKLEQWEKMWKPVQLKGDCNILSYSKKKVEKELQDKNMKDLQYKYSRFYNIE